MFVGHDRRTSRMSQEQETSIRGNAGSEGMTDGGTSSSDAIAEQGKSLGQKPGD